MTTPRQITWKGGSSAHAPVAQPRSQRALVEASLMCVGTRPARRWDERTRTMYAPRPS